MVSVCYLTEKDLQNQLHCLRGSMNSSGTCLDCYIVTATYSNGRIISKLAPTASTFILFAGEIVDKRFYNKITARHEIK